MKCTRPSTAATRGVGSVKSVAADTWVDRAPLAGAAVERRMMATGAVEREEVLGFPLDGGETGQVRIIPDVAIVLLMEAFDVAIAVHVAPARRALRYRPPGLNAPTAPEHADAYVPHRSSCRYRTGCSPNILKVCQTCTAKAQASCARRSLISCPRRTGGDDVDGVETRHPCAAGEIVWHNIDLTQLLRGRWLQMGINYLGAGRRPAGAGHPCRLQHPFDAGDAGQRVAVWALSRVRTAGAPMYFKPAPVAAALPGRCAPG